MDENLGLVGVCSIDMYNVEFERAKVICESFVTLLPYLGCKLKLLIIKRNGQKMWTSCAYEGSICVLLTSSMSR